MHELTQRYFRSRGPATLQDYVTWSGLTVKDAKAGIGNLPGEFVTKTIEGKTYIFIPLELPDMKKLQTSFLMPDYDEYGMGYKDRSAIFDAKVYQSAISRNNPVFNRMIILDGKIEGTWQRLIKGKKTEVELYPFKSLNKTDKDKLKSALLKFNHFIAD